MVALFAGFKFDAKAGIFAASSLGCVSPVSDWSIKFFPPLVDQGVGFGVGHVGVSALDEGHSSIFGCSWDQFWLVQWRNPVCYTFDDIAWGVQEAFDSRDFLASLDSEEGVSAPWFDMIFNFAAAEMSDEAVEPVNDNNFGFIFRDLWYCEAGVEAGKVSAFHFFCQAVCALRAWFDFHFRVKKGRGNCFRDELVHSFLPFW